MPNVEGVREAVSMLERIKAWAAESAEQGVEEAALTCLTLAKQLAPVRTGRLRDSIAVRRIAVHRVAVEAAAPYSGFVEHGTRYAKPRPYMRPAAAEAASQLFKRLSKTPHLP